MLSNYHQVLESLIDSKVYRNRKKVKSANSGEVYTIAIRKSDSRWTCSCKGWIFTYQKKGEDCGHIIEIKRTYGDRSRIEIILTKIKNFREQIETQTSIRTTTVTLWIETWSRDLKDEAEMLQLYFENENRQAEADALGIQQIRTRLATLASIA